MSLEKIIVLDDQEVIRRSLSEQLRRRRYSVATAGTLGEAESLLASDSFDLMFVDVRLPDGDGTELLERLATRPEKPLMVMITGHGSIQSAVECMQLGAFDYLLKPYSEEQIEILLKKAAEHSHLVKVNHYLSTEGTDGPMELIGQSPPMKHLRRMIRKVAATEATVLINGESGTGKELVARELHNLSPLVGRPYIKVNCAAIMETLIESEFFGHEKGAYTGATQKREGRFELANNGTILLDEISEVAPKVQAKLLRVLQEQEFERVGGNKTINVNVRVFATTNRNLSKCVREGDFREDLFYRLNVFPIVVPPLRERGEDILLLARYFVDRSIRDTGVRVAGLATKTEELLMQHNWPGNVRELENTIARAVIMSEPGKLIGPESLGILGPVREIARPSMTSLAEEMEESSPRPAPETSSLPLPATGALDKQTLADVERDYIIRILKKTGGAREQAADYLQISPRTLRNKITRYREEGFAIP